jgi:hypothetical protein
VVTTFPGWREIGAVMRWARTGGATVKRTRYGRPHVFPDGSTAVYVCHQWSFGERKRVTVGSYLGRTDPDMSVVNGAARHDLYPEDAAEALNVLGAFRVIPVELMEVPR